MTISSLAFASMIASVASAGDCGVQADLELKLVQPRDLSKIKKFGEFQVDGKLETNLGPVHDYVELALIF
jgi:hypothetical protein